MPLGMMGFLAILVTVFGAVLFALVFLFVVRGNKLPPAGATPHRIQYASLEISTDRVVMLAIVFALMTVVPLGGYFWLVDRTQGRQAKHDLCESTLASVRNKPVRIFATIDSRNREALKGATAVLIRKRPDKDVIECGGPQTIANRDIQFVTTLSEADDFFVIQVKGVDNPLAAATVTPFEQRVIIPLDPP